LSHPHLEFKCVPQFPSEYGNNPSLEMVMNRLRKILLHEKTMDRVIGNRNCKTKKYICNEHHFEIAVKKKTFTHNGQKITWSFDLIVPVGAGVKSSINPSESSKGLGGECAVIWILEAISAQMRPISASAHECNAMQMESLSSNLAQSNLALQLFVEMASPEPMSLLNPMVRIASGLGLERGNVASFTIDGQNFFHANLVKKTYNKTWSDQPVVWLGMCDEEATRRTGFTDEKALLTYFFIFCNGEMNTIKQKVTPLTWYEEWFLLFEYQWG
jgi:hypothetical protein